MNTNLDCKIFLGGILVKSKELRPRRNYCFQTMNMGLSLFAIRRVVETIILYQVSTSISNLKKVVELIDQIARQIR